jgi:hypothetical protein
MIYVLKIIWDYRVPLLKLIVCNIARYPQFATSTSIRYQPAIRYLLPWCRDGALAKTFSCNCEKVVTTPQRFHATCLVTPAIVYQKKKKT